MSTPAPLGSGPWWDELTEYPSPLDVKRLRREATDFYRESKRVVEWLHRLADRSESQSKDTRFESLAEACAADAKNYRASAKGLIAAIESAEGRQ